MKTGSFFTHLYVVLSVVLFCCSCEQTKTDNLFVTCPEESVDYVLCDSLEILVPNEGGLYTIWIDSPDSVFMFDPIEWVGMHDFYANENGEAFLCNRINYDKQLNGNLLTIDVKKLQSSTTCTEHFRVYGSVEPNPIVFTGPLVGTVYIKQEGGTVELPEPLHLGESGLSAVNLIKNYLVKQIEAFLELEDYLCKMDDSYRINYQIENLVSEILDQYYIYNGNIRTFLESEASLLNLYGSYYKLYRAMYNSVMVRYWEKIPYYAEQTVSYVSTSQEVLADMEKDLLAVLDELDEKEYNSLGDANDFFFASKDVARALLANVYMLKGDYVGAIPLLQEVIAGGFYQLDVSVEYNQKESKEIIFGLMRTNESSTETSSLIPYITLSDMYLSLAECQYGIGDEKTARETQQQVLDTKKLSLADLNFMEQLKAARKELFFKRGNYFTSIVCDGLDENACSLEEFRTLFPIVKENSNIPRE